MNAAQRSGALTQFDRMSKDRAGSNTWCCYPSHLLEKARRRIRTVAWLLLVLMAVGSIVDAVYARWVADIWDGRWFVASGIATLSSIAVIIVTRHPRVGHVAVMWLGLAYEIIICFIMAIIMPWMVYVDSGSLPYITWVSLLIILFPLVIPSPPRMTLWTALLAAGTRPAGLLVLEGIGVIQAGIVDYCMSVLSPMFAVAFAYVGSRIIYDMTEDVAAAKRMGSYQLDSMLGRGGMGEVWLARHRFLARPAAVKFVRPESLTSDPKQQRVQLARFEREAQATALLRSPHTIDVYDFGISDDGRFYYVMELLDGLDLDVLVNRFGALPPNRAMHFLGQVCESLGEAHDRGLIHRDVKPANVYVCRQGREYDFIKVLDFGLVKASGAGLDDGHLTGAGIHGTPNFMAPEQAMGSRTDHRSDIYALGCVAYWMLTGELVFRGQSVLQTMMMHVDQVPRPPAERSIHPIPRELDDIVLACLAKDPSERPQHVDVVADVMDSCAGPDRWTQAEAGAWWKTNFDVEASPVDVGVVPGSKFPVEDQPPIQPLGVSRHLSPNAEQ